MTGFWVAAALLLIVALGLLLPPLLRRRAGAANAAAQATAAPGNLAILREQLAQLDAEQAAGAITAAQHDATHREIERRVLDEEAVDERPPAADGRATGTAFAIVLLLPLLAAGLYAAIGSPHAIDQPAAAPASADNVSMQDVEAMVARLAARMQAQPGDPQGWALLGRSYAAMQRFPEASQAYARAIALSPNDAQLLADHADVLAMLHDSKVSGEPEKLVLRALRIAPDNLKALALAGSAAFERHDYASAISHWTKARALAPAGSEFAAGLDRSLDEARSSAPSSLQSGVAAAAVPPWGQGESAGRASGTDPTAAASPARLSGSVSLAPALAARAAPGDTVFVFARAADGPRMPLAIIRKSVADLPFAFTLDDAMAMSPTMKLSNFASVVVGARISKSGNAMPQPGDLIGQIGPVTSGTGGLAVQIDGVQR